MIRRCQVCQAITDGDFCPECGAFVIGGDEAAPPGLPNMPRTGVLPAAPSPTSRTKLMYAVVAVLAGLALLGGIIFAVTRMRAGPERAGSPVSVVTVTTTSSATASASSGGETAVTESTSSTTASMSPTPVYLSLDGSVCEPTRVSLGPIGTAAKDNDHTSCPFAVAVRSAYAHSGAVPPERVELRAHSPVTGRTYTMVCEGSQPVVCVGGNDARVLLFEGPPASNDG
ncbi:MAG: hypothetical protein IPH03_11530 [Tetrasphaera sp.]|nr:hypothetical protein [Tetrasphaera sp.]